MNKRHSGALRIALYAGLILVTACTARSDAEPTRAADLGLCSAGDASCNVRGGYAGNTVTAASTGVTISGGGLRGAPNQVTGSYATIGGGQGNLAGEGSTIGGGSANTAIHFYATVGGGSSNLADGQEAVVAGGFKNTASQRFAVVGGGSGNTASDINSTVAGGTGNVASFHYATVGGGAQNLASSVASVVAGGDHNLAQGAYSAIVGGINNNADGYIATVGGGIGNTATGSYAVTPGGFANAAGGDYSFAAGRSAKIEAGHPGVFLFADASPFAFPSLTPDEFAVRATGGVRFVTAIDPAGSPAAGVRLSPGGGAWEILSDYHAKAGFAPVDGRQVLQQLMTIPISTWHYRSQDASVRHMGPMAQDFSAAFGLGQDNRYISTVDEEGVALAAIQELYRMVQHNGSMTQADQVQQQMASLQRRLSFSNGLTAASLLIALLALGRRAPGKKN